MKTKKLHPLFVAAAFIYSVFHPEKLTAAVLTGPVWNPANGIYYYLLAESSWTDAQAEAITLNGNLATVRSAAEQSWIFSTFGNFGGVDRSLWIGLNDVSVEGTFEWVSGEPLTYTNWLPGQPDSNPADAPENFVQIIGTGNGFNATPNTWNDIGNTSAGFPQLGPIHGVVEVVPEPSSVGILICGAALGFYRLKFRANRRNDRRVVSSS